MHLKALFITFVENGGYIVQIRVPEQILKVLVKRRVVTRITRE
jgi:hypothetical protein